MFNTPILDIVLGLVFIFLLYSLLATSIKEAIATGLGLRARMLRKGIIEGMLTDTPDLMKLTSMLKGLVDYFREMLFIVLGRFGQPKQLGYKFYQHPLMKNYGSNKIFSHPSYLSSTNFCLILIETLKQDLADKKELVAAALLPSGSTKDQQDAFAAQLVRGSDIDQVKALLDYYTIYYSVPANYPRPKWWTTVMGIWKNIPDDQAKLEPAIGPETLKLLRLHLDKSLFNINDFGTRLTHWFDDTMDRVSGWYKRQVQVILLIIGVTIAYIFNVDVIDITTRLSKDDKLRDKLVQSAVEYSKAHKELPKDPKVADSIKTDSEYRAEVNARFGRVDSMVDHDIHDVNTLMALGYGDYGRTNTLYLGKLRNKHHLTVVPFADTHDNYGTTAKEGALLLAFLKDSLRYASDLKPSNAATAHHQAWSRWRKNSYRDNVLMAQIRAMYKPAKESSFGVTLDSLVNDRFYGLEEKAHSICVKTGFMWFVFHTTKHKWLGFLLLGFAVCLGAPFWFDMLNKVVNLRSTGKKEEDSRDSGGKGGDKSASPQPVIVQVNNQPGNEEAAVG